jgi:PAS domain S-box-containing protein
MPYQSSQSVNAQAAKLQGLLQSAAAAIVIIDRGGTIENVNPATSRMFGYEASELIGQNVKILMPEPYRAQHDSYVANYLNTGTRKIIGIGREVSGLRKDGAVFPVHLAVSEFLAGEKRYFTGIIHDLSDRKHVEEALRESERRLAQAQKMEAVGQLTGGIAHDFNNLLTIITGNLELVQDKLEREELRVFVKKAMDAAELGAQLTSQLLSFARKRTQELQTIQLNDLLLSVTDMLHRTLGEQVSLSKSLSPDLWDTLADPNQFQTAIVNLTVNGRDAMPNGGRIYIETRNTLLDAGQLGTELDVEPGEYVQLSISDTGTGMAPEVRGRIFEPFFTTKEKGRGTGLGLSMVYGFVKQSGGHITVYSELGQGTTFNIYLPRTGRGASPNKQQSTATSGLTALQKGVVLVVEDDPGVRELTVSRLKAIGYKVIEAADGRKAGEILKSAEPVDLVFTDLVMPGGVSGLDVATLARETRPGIKVLLTSGYAEDLVPSDPTLAKLKILRKPYRQADLVVALKEVFGSENPSSN